MSQLFETFRRRASSQGSAMSSFCSGLRLSKSRFATASGFSSRQVEAQTGAFDRAAAAATPAVGTGLMILRHGILLFLLPVIRFPPRGT
jgi:hypothetical protein